MNFIMKMHLLCDEIFTFIIISNIKEIMEMTFRWNTSVDVSDDVLIKISLRDC